MPPNKVRRGGPQATSPENQAATKLPDKDSLVDFAPAYIAVMVDRFGTPRRRPYLNLHHANKAVQRAKAQGREAWLILCKLEPVTADLDLNGEVAS
jgi:hypothetical protein